MHWRATLLILAGSLIQAVPLIGQERQDQSREVDHAVRHEPTGLIFPRVLAGLTIVGQTEYANPKAGISLRYETEDGNVADIYLYNGGHESLTDDSEHRAIIDEAGAAAGGIRRMEELGHYAEVEVSEEADLSNYGGEENPFSFLKIEANYRHEGAYAENDRLKDVQRDSLIAVGIWKNHFVKIRSTFPRWDKATDAERIKERAGFVDDVARLILEETTLWPEIPRMLEDYRRDPLSEAGKTAAADLVAIADSSRLMTITVDSAALPFLSEDRDYAFSSELLAAYVIGNIIEQMKQEDFDPQTLAGVEKMLEVYRLLREKHGAEAMEELDEMETARKAGNLGEFLKSRSE